MKKSYTKHRNPVVSAIEYFLSIVYLIALFAISFLPNFYKLTQNVGFIALSTIITVAVFLFYAIAEKDTSHPAFSISMLLAIPAFIVYLFCDSDRIAIMIYTLLLPVFIFLFILVAKNQKNDKEPADVALATVLLFVFIQTSSCWFIGYVNESTDAKYLIIAFVSAIIGVIVCIRLLRSRILEFQKISEIFFALTLPSRKNSKLK